MTQSGVRKARQPSRHANGTLKQSILLMTEMASQAPAQTTAVISLSVITVMTLLKLNAIMSMILCVTVTHP